MKEKKKRYLAANIDKELHAKLLAFVANNGGNISWFVEKAIEEKLAREEK